MTRGGVGHFIGPLDSVRLGTDSRLTERLSKRLMLVDDSLVEPRPHRDESLPIGVADALLIVGKVVRIRPDHFYRSLEGR
jgi:hypothetical protein